jgi:CBS domain-containing protein
MTTPVVIVPESGTIWDAWSLLISGRVRHAVVVSGERCIGIVDDRDLVKFWQHGPAELQTTPIRALVRRSTSCVLPDATLSQVAALMNVERIDAVPVVDAHGKLLGLITAGDVLHAVSRHGLYEDPPRSAVEPAPASR